MQPRPPEPDRPSDPAPIAEPPESVKLARRAKDGDESALDELFTRYYDRVYRIVRIRMGARIRGAIDPNTIEAATRAEASSQIRSITPSDHASLIQWLAGIAERRILVGQRLPSQPAPGMLTASSSGQVASPVPASYVGNPELKEIYDACVEGLPGRRREIVLLREYARCSWPQIVAEMRYCDEASAKDEYRRAQLQIAGLLRKRLRG